MGARATVAIPTFNAEEYLSDLLDRVLEQSRDVGFEVEVLVIDSGSSDATADIVRARPSVRLHQIANSEFGHGRTRNLAAELATGDVVVYLTQDAVPGTGWLAAMVSPFDRDASLAAVVGRQQPRPDCCPPVRRDVINAFEDLTDQHGVVRHNGQPFLSNVNAGYRRRVLLSRPFRDVDYAEDITIAADFAAVGLHTAYAPDAVVEHSHDLHLRDYYRRMYEEARGVRSARTSADTWRRPSVIRLLAATVVGTLRDWRFVLADRRYRAREKLSWLVLVPLYNIARRVAIARASFGHVHRGPVTLAPDARAATRGSASLLTGQIVSRLLALVFVLVATHQLAPAQFGRYSTVGALVVFANFLADFGTGPAITRLTARRPDDGDTLLAGSLPASLALGAGAYALAVGFAAVTYPSRQVIDVAIGLAGVPFASVLSSVLGVLDGVGQLSRRAVVNTVQSFVIGSGAVAIAAGLGVRGALVCLATAPIVGLLLASTFAARVGVWRTRPRWDGATTATLLRAALPFALSGGLTALTMRFDVLLLSVLRSPADTAVYDLSLRLLEAPAVLSAAVCGPLLFIISRRLGLGDRDGAARAYHEALRALYLIGLPLSVAIVMLASPAADAVLGPRFHEVALPLRVMGGAQWLTFVIFVQGALVMGGDQVGRGVRVGVMNAAVTVGLDLVLVPLFGVAGAASAMVVTWVFSVVALHMHHLRTVGIATAFPSSRIVGATAVMAVVLAALSPAPLIVDAAAGVLAYLVMLLATGEIGGHDVRRLGAAIRS